MLYSYKGYPAVNMNELSYISIFINLKNVTLSERSCGRPHIVMTLLSNSSKPSKSKLLIVRDIHTGKTVKSMRMKHEMWLGYTGENTEGKLCLEQ